MNPQNQTIREISEQSKKLLDSINFLSSWNPKTSEDETFDAILESSKNRIEGAVENVKVAFDFYNQNISPDEKNT